MPQNHPGMFSPLLLPLRGALPFRVRRGQQPQELIHQGLVFQDDPAEAVQEWHRALPLHTLHRASLSFQNKQGFQQKKTQPPRSLYKAAQPSAGISSHTPIWCPQIISCRQSCTLRLSGHRMGTLQAQPRTGTEPWCTGGSECPETAKPCLDFMGKGAQGPRSATTPGNPSMSPQEERPGAPRPCRRSNKTLPRDILISLSFLS